MDISIIILNYKSKGFTMACLKSIMEADFSNLKYEIIVVDNDSDDSIGEILAWKYPQVVFIQNDKNIGMGAGNNVGIGNDFTLFATKAGTVTFEFVNKNKKKISVY